MDMEIKPEDGTVTISYENAFKMSLVHGPIVGIIHIVTPQEDHVTKIFFFDGQSHTAFGFSLSFSLDLVETDDDKEEYARMMALFMIIQTIWGIDIASIGENFWSIKRIDTEKKEEKNIVYTFCASNESVLKYVLTSDGLSAFLNSVSFLKKEEEKNIIRIIE